MFEGSSQEIFKSSDDLRRKSMKMDDGQCNIFYPVLQPKAELAFYQDLYPSSQKITNMQSMTTDKGVVLGYPGLLLPFNSDAVQEQLNALKAQVDNTPNIVAAGIAAAVANLQAQVDHLQAQVDNISKVVASGIAAAFDHYHQHR